MNDIMYQLLFSEQEMELCSGNLKHLVVMYMYYALVHCSVQVS